MFKRTVLAVGLGAALATCRAAGEQGPAAMQEDTPEEAAAGAQEETPKGNRRCSSCNLSDSSGDAVSVFFDSNPVINSVGETAVVNISVIGNIKNLNSLGVSFTYSDDVVGVESVSRGTLTDGCEIQSNRGSPSPLIIVAECFAGHSPFDFGGERVQELGEPGTLFSVTFRAIGRGISPLVFSTYANIVDGCLLNLGMPACAPVDGQITVAHGEVICAGDCDQDGRVAIFELVRGVNISLGNDVLASCRVFDSDDSGDVGVQELVQAVSSALSGRCDSSH